MSRTFRKPNWERQQKTKPGSKYGGFYRQGVEGAFVGHYYFHFLHWRTPTPREKSQAYWQLHSDAWHYEYDRFYWHTKAVRQKSEQDLKTYNKKQVNRYLHDPERYELQCRTRYPMRYQYHPQW